MKSRNSYELELMRKSGVIAASALKKAIETIKVGITELEVDKLPKKERQLLAIQRKFNVNDETYSYLLQKKAEAIPTG